MVGHVEEYGISGVSEEKCTRCGSAIYPFSTRIAISDRQRYCVKCAEELDARYMLKNSCSLCGKLLDRRQVKFVLPSIAYGSASMPLQERLACSPCYNKALRRNRIRMIRTGGAEADRTSLRKRIMGQLMKKQAEAYSV